MDQRTIHTPALSETMLLRAYSLGYFPMSESRDDPDIFWVEPKIRAIIPLNGFHMSRSLKKTITSNRFTVTCNRDFSQIVDECAATTDDRPDTWINPVIKNSFVNLHQLGYAHSIECWHDGVLAGGLYGLSYGRVFCGESMFSRKSNASKVALAWLVATMKMAGYKLLDCQFMTDHLATLGAVEIPQNEYKALFRKHNHILEKTLQDQAGQDKYMAEIMFSAPELAAHYGPSLPAAFSAVSALSSAGAADLSSPCAASPSSADAVFDGLALPPSLVAGCSGNISPGYVIAQLLTQTS